MTKRIRRCDAGCPQMVKCKNKDGRYYLCSIHKVEVGVITRRDGSTFPVMGAVMLEVKNGYPLKGDWCKYNKEV